MRPKEVNTLKMIRGTYGAILISVAAQFQHRPEVLAGIMMRESAGGTSPELDTPGPKGRGDLEMKVLPDGTKAKIYHGHGLFQIDDRTFPDFCTGDDWKDPAKNAAKAAADLRDQRTQVCSECSTFKVTATGAQIEQMSIAGFNCGADRAVHALRHGEDIDKYTAGGDYSAAVLAFASVYAGLPTA